jgi:hypothetical protein
MLTTRKYTSHIGDDCQYLVKEENGPETLKNEFELVLNISDVGRESRPVTRDEVVTAMKNLKSHIQKGYWPPA